MLSFTCIFTVLLRKNDIKKFLSIYITTTNYIMSTETDLYNLIMSEYESSQSDSSSQTETDDMSDKFCFHTDIIQDSDSWICVACGQEIEKIIQHEKEWTYGNSKISGGYNRVQLRKIEQKSIQKDVDMMNFSQNVIDLADKIFKEATNGGIYRGDSRKSMIFASIYYAYKILGNTQSKEQLRQFFNIDNTVASSGIKFIELNSPNDSPIHSVYTTTEDLIIDVLSKFQVPDKHKPKVLELYSRIHNRSSELNRARSYSVTCALVYYWMRRKRINIDISEFIKVVGLGQNTILDLARVIAGLFNKKLE
jgi:hypothetical protein